MNTCFYLPDPNCTSQPCAYVQHNCVNPLWMIVPLVLVLVLVIFCDDYRTE